MFDWMNDFSFVLGIVVGCGLIGGAWWVFLYLADKQK